MSGVKHDVGTVAPMDLLSNRSYARGISSWPTILGHGATKYSKHNWRHGLEYSRLVAATLRHVTAFNRGEDLDSESGLPHSAHAMCCLMFLTWMTQTAQTWMTVGSIT
jgi:hypothetical protein